MDGIELVPAVATGEYADQRRVGDDQVVGFDPRPGPAGDPDGQQPTVTSQGCRRLLRQGAANRVIDDVHPAAVGHLPQAAGQVAVWMVDGVVRAEASAKLGPGLVAHDRDHPGPEGPAELHGGDPATAGRSEPGAAARRGGDPATAARSEQGEPLARFDMSAVDQTDPRGEVGYPEAGGVDVGQAGWNAERRLGGGQAFLGEGAVALNEAGYRHG